MPFFQKIKNFLSASSESMHQLTPKNDEGNKEFIQYLSTTECCEVAGGPQVRNESDV